MQKVCVSDSPKPILNAQLCYHGSNHLRDINNIAGNHLVCAEVDVRLINNHFVIAHDEEETWDEHSKTNMHLEGIFIVPKRFLLS